MAAPKGNQNAKGNKGGARKSAYQERADAELLWRLFTEKMDRDEVMKVAKTGNYSILESFLAKAMAGSDKHQIEMFKKCFPDNINFSANLNQKSMATLEKNIRGLLDGIGKRQAVGVDVKLKVKKKVIKKRT